MKVTFTHTPITGGAATAEVLSLGTRLSPMGPMEFGHSGIAQISHPIRLGSVKIFPRGGGQVTERFVSQKEHASYWAGVVWTRVTLGNLRGRAGTLTFEDDRSGRIRLADAVCVSAGGSVTGILTLIQFEFVGSNWVSG